MRVTSSWLTEAAGSVHTNATRTTDCPRSNDAQALHVRPEIVGSMSPSRRRGTSRSRTQIVNVTVVTLRHPGAERDPLVLTDGVTTGVPPPGVR